MKLQLIRPWRPSNDTTSLGPEPVEPELEVEEDVEAEYFGS